jgi:hypothetical protein
LLFRFIYLGRFDRCWRGWLRREELFINFLGKVAWEVPVKHFMVHLVHIDFNIKLAEVTPLLYLLDLH